MLATQPQGCELSAPRATRIIHASQDNLIDTLKILKNGERPEKKTRDQNHPPLRNRGKVRFRQFDVHHMQGQSIIRTEAAHSETFFESLMSYLVYLLANVRRRLKEISAEV